MTVASSIIRDTAQTISNTTGQPATTLDVYGGYVFGTKMVPDSEQADSATPLSAFVPASYLANNGMQDWTVGDFQSRMGAKLGSTANRPVLTTGA